MRNHSTTCSFEKELDSRCELRVDYILIDRKDWRNQHPRCALHNVPEMPDRWDVVYMDKVERVLTLRAAIELMQEELEQTLNPNRKNPVSAGNLQEATRAS